MMDNVEERALSYVCGKKTQQENHTKNNIIIIIKISYKKSKQKVR
jgi:hypothetical protein